MFELSWTLLTNVLSYVGSLLCLTGPMRFGIESIGAIMDNFFKDRTHSAWDIFVGILLLGQVKRQVPKVKDSTSQQTYDKQAWQKDYIKKEHTAVRDVNRYVDFAMAIYNWPTYMTFACFFRPLTFLYAIYFLRPFYFWTRGLSSMFPLLFRRREIIGDGMFYHKTASFMASTPSETKLKDLKFANFANGVFQTPYCIVTDNVAKAIVVTIKGSSSFPDFLTDANFVAKGFPEELMGKQFDDYPAIKTTIDSSQGSFPFIHLHGKKIYIHPGMYLCARSMFGEVESQLISLIQSEKEVKDYKIVVTGHSLGAGVASVLTLMLQDQWGDRVRGYCFSPPGCMISADGLEEARKCILSFVLGDDMVPRLSHHSLKDLREDCRHIMEMEHGKIFGSLKRPVFIKVIMELVYWPFLGPLTVIINLPQYAIIKYCQWRYGIDLVEKLAIKGPSLVEASEQEDMKDQALRLYTPGQLLHLITNDHTCEVEQKWINHDDLQELVIGWHMVADHMAKRVRRCVKHENHRILFIPAGFFPAPIRRMVELLY